MDTRMTYICQTVQKNNSNIRVWGMLLLLAFVWGSSFILMKVAIFDSAGDVVYTPLEVAALRIAIAAIVLLPISIKCLKSIKRPQVLPLLAIGTLGNLIPAYLFTSAVSEIPSAIAGMLNALTPLFTMVIAALVFKTAVSKVQFSGLSLGFIGAVLLAVGGFNIESLHGGIEWWASGRVVLATLCYGISVNILKNKLAGVPSTAIASIALFMVLPPALIVLTYSNALKTFTENPHGGTGMIAVTVLAVVGTAGALILFNSLIKRTNALTASSVTYILPVFATMWGWLDGENLTVIHLLGGIVILFGVALVNGRGKRRGKVGGDKKVGSFE
jgi:drug/metabolite transporter (DMT)-like permease